MTPAEMATMRASVKSQLQQWGSVSYFTIRQIWNIAARRRPPRMVAAEFDRLLRDAGVPIEGSWTPGGES